MARKPNPNSKRQIQLREKEERKKRKEAEQRAKEKAQELEAQQQAQQALQEQLEKLQAEKAQLEQQVEQSQQEEPPIAEHKQELPPPEELPSQEPPAYASLPEEEEDLIALMNEALTDEKMVEPEQEQGPEPDDHFVDEDFDGDFEPLEEEPEIIQESDQEGKVRAGIPPNEMAEIFVEGFDNLLSWGAPLAYKKTAFNKEEKRRWRQIKHHNKTKGKQELVLDDDDLELMDRYAEFEEYVDSLPLTDKEKRSLIIPLKVMLKEKGGDIPPGWALFYAAVMVALPRLSPIMMMQVAKQLAKGAEKVQAKHERTDFAEAKGKSSGLSSE